jgi:hypothetical protein
MGIGFVLFFWAIAGLIVVSAGGAVLGGLATMLTRGIQKSRKRAVILVATFPFVCLGWAGFLFIFQAVVNAALLRRDPGLGDTWHCPLQNGYAITMIDVTDQGWVYNTKTQPGDTLTEREDAVAGVRQLQVAGRYILGASDTHWFAALGKESFDTDLYFILDTQTDRRSNFQKLEDLTVAASKLGIQIQLETIGSVYSERRFTWFDWAVGILLVLPLAAYFVILAKWVVKLRRTRPSVALPA